MKRAELIADLGAALDRRASAKTRDWWTRYLKGVIPFRGVGTPAIRDELIAWRERHGLDALPLERQLALALALFEGEHTEDKLAGTLYLQLFLYDRMPWRTLLEALDGVFERRLIYDWNTCDWLCVRVLGPMIGLHGAPCARAIAGWRRREYLWHARSSLVSFVKGVADPELLEIILDTASTLIRREERFAKTAVGWLLRDLSRHAPEAVRIFVDEHREHFSADSLNNATRHLREPTSVSS